MGRKQGTFLCSIVKAAAFVLLTPAVVQALWNQWKDSHWFWGASALASSWANMFQTLISQSQALNQAWRNVPGLNNAAGAVPKDCNMMFSFIFECALIKKYYFLPFQCELPQRHKKNSKILLESWNVWRTWVSPDVSLKAIGSFKTPSFGSFCWVFFSK